MYRYPDGPSITIKEAQLLVALLEAEKMRFEPREEFYSRCDELIKKLNRFQGGGY